LNFSFKIHRYESGVKIELLSLLLKDDSVCLLDQFLLKCDDQVKTYIACWLDAILDEWGLDMFFFQQSEHPRVLLMSIYGYKIFFYHDKKRILYLGEESQIRNDLIDILDYLDLMLKDFGEITIDY
jgi:hypothetical protein